MTSSDAELLIERFYSAETKDQAKEVLTHLGPHKCIELLNPMRMPNFLKEGIAYFRLDNTEETTKPHLEAIYRNAFYIMMEAILTAESEGKPLRILMGEIHGDRTGLAIELMLYDIADRLGIQNFAIERSKENFQIELDGREITIHGTDGMWEEIAILNPGEALSERSKPENAQRTATIRVEAGARKNDYWLAEWVFNNQPGARLIASDPRFAAFFSNEHNSDNTLYRREEATSIILENEAKENNHIISQHGIAHIPGLLAADNAAYILAFNTQQVLAFDAFEINGVEKDEQSENRRQMLNKPHFVTGATTKDIASMIGKDCIGKAGKPARVIHLLCPGRGIDTAKEAAELAKAVNAELGEEMAALYASRKQEQSSQGNLPGAWAARTAKGATGPYLRS